MGLGALYGASGIERGMRQRIMERLQMEQAQQQMDLALRSDARADQSLQAQIEANTLAREAAANEKLYQRGKDEFDQGAKLAELTPPGFMPVSSPIAGRLVKVGAATPVEARPEVTAGPLQPGDTREAHDAGFMKTETPLQADRRIDNERVAAQQASLAADREKDNARQEAAARATEEDRLRRDRDRREDNARAERMLVLQLRAATNTAERAALQNELTELKVRTQQEDRASARMFLDDTKAKLAELRDHPGLDTSVGTYEFRSGATPDSAAFNSRLNNIKNRLTLQNLNLLKGAMSDRDIVFISDASSRLGNTRVSADEYRTIIDETLKLLDDKAKVIDAFKPAAAPGAPGTTNDPMGLRKP